MAGRLGLGTVQFGLAYGIANEQGRVAAAEARAILQLAREAGISVLDTAPAYGQAETVLGSLLDPADRFRLISKTVAVPAPTIGDAETALVRAGFEATLRALGRRRLDGLLVHQADDLLKPGGERLYDLLQDWRAQGRVDKIGVSVYERRQIDEIFARYALDLVQLPINVCDQRLLRDGTLSALVTAGVEIHARSLFLQGLLLMDEASLPAFVAPWRKTLRAFHCEARSRGATPLQAALAFVCQRPEIAVALVGVLSAEQLRQCLEAEQMPVTLDWTRFAIDDARLIDPRRWPAKGESR